MYNPLKRASELISSILGVILSSLWIIVSYLLISNAYNYSDGAVVIMVSLFILSISIILLLFSSLLFFVKKNTSLFLNYKRMSIVVIVMFSILTILCFLSFILFPTNEFKLFFGMSLAVSIIAIALKCCGLSLSQQATLQEKLSTIKWLKEENILNEAQYEAAIKSVVETTNEL